MGTRGLDGVVVDGAIRASYNQFDTYPDGLGTIVLGYARTVSKMDATELEAERQRWRDVVLVKEDASPTAEQIADLQAKGYRASRVSSGDDWYAWLRENQGTLAAYRDTGYMLDSQSFGFGSLFCEWAWLVDLDARTFECYVGFQKEPVTAGRWAGGESDSGYYGVKLIRTFSLDDLPTDAGFVAEVNSLAGYDDDDE